jgi:hypothetical protein
VFELKWDGFRGIAETDADGGVVFYSRTQKDKRATIVAASGTEYSTHWLRFAKAGVSS